METELLGLVAGVFTTFGFIPQVFRVFQLRSAKEISLPFTISVLVGIAIWVVYGISLRSLSMVLWNSIGFCLMALLLFAKLRYG